MNRKEDFWDRYKIFFLIVKNDISIVYRNIQYLILTKFEYKWYISTI